MLIAQVSDTHILEYKHKELFNVNPAKNLATIVDHISSLSQKPEYIILSGDISGDMPPTSYKIVAELIARLKIKTLFIPGNHDHKEVMRNELSMNTFIYTKNIKIEDWNLILLDSCLHNEGFGLMSKNELDFLDEMLSLCHKKCCIFIHHHPIEIDSPLMDQHILKNRDDFISILDKYPFKKNIFFGHVHQVFEKNIGNNFFFSCPSTAYQLIPKAVKLLFDMRFIGYRLIEIGQEDISTTVIKINKEPC